ncbi:ankyrin repeat domain-containing protein [Thioalkalivibrio sp. XN8]|uniref:ankyrin repeat domain-containing protein n=1 Tax=Thioalkalivibrio sp. XN8 TaxID=2712863 RepID=UPI0013EDA569|nr:ankyrin repeat domain-containing protein [Thioalkalivibrio sp. XN8]NGP54014.1 ankyrin repeat domain-containing protein [Thioalkalivibrio sp. XN8]
MSAIATIRSATRPVALLLALGGIAAALPAEAVDPRGWDGRLETMHDYAAPASEGKTGLMHAAGDGDLALARQLLAAGAGVDDRNANGGTALMYAVSAGDVAMARLLLEAGADPNARARIGWTPLLVGAAKGRADAIKLLLDAGADAADADAYGWTPLMRAVSAGHVAAVDALLGSERANLEAREESGATALHIAAGRGYTEIVRRLLDAGAEASAADGAGRTPADVARLQGHGEAAALLTGRVHRPG